MGQQDISIESVMAEYPPKLRPTINKLRKLVREVAKSNADVGELVETLKWGQPSFLPKGPRIGTTVRMDAVSKDPVRVALYFHCQTTLVETFRELYSDTLNFEGNRAIVLDVSRPLPEAELRHCIEMALTYHKAKRTKAA
ncbi:hypothetical protein BN1012_Phect3197 [Candidatus Phaeomarinobacter ectocarpi]|uniref:YdhG-like domain-containing protein n=1 Tax=Candidatus Phaeomarinibacter ectocarpi TaxID=1458461 RepID=X5MHU5_9HYPH|nr:DUF1801 domain-containing protein [Candidatus Phaeomarinobacter ectocarpi]CDO61409.1 hypothetical protein BN1012_Phect3197 [Candidatus Phaeomarinobacter ectocarpi]